MRILVDGVDVAESVHASKKILLDTMILCYAHDRLSSHHDAASLIIKASINGLIRAFVSLQNLLEFYSIMTGKRVKNPLSSDEAAEICMLYEESGSFGKLPPSATTYRETFESAKHLSIVNGDIFDCVLAYTCKGNVDTLWTENTKHFKKYSLLKVENPLKWKWEEK
jgi:predicted nucleic acid-binding protein